MVTCHGQAVSVRRYILRELAETRGCGEGVIWVYYAKLAPRPNGTPGCYGMAPSTVLRA
jgi:hypothetical protein